MEVGVYKYAWEYFSGRADEWLAMTSTKQVTRDFVRTRTKLADSSHVRNYQTLEDTVELVPGESVVEGVYHPELHHKGFQRQVKR